MQEKIKCQYCGRRNSIDEDLCLSCGAKLPALSSILQFNDGVYSANEIREMYLEAMANHSGSLVVTGSWGNLR